MEETRSTPVDKLLADIGDEITDAKGIFFMKDMCIVNREKLLDLIDAAQRNLPTDIAQGRSIIQSKEQLIANANKRADQIIADAREKAAQMVEENDIVKQSKARATEVLQQCSAKMASLRHESISYVDKSLESAEVTVEELLKDIQKIRVEIQRAGEKGTI